MRLKHALPEWLEALPRLPKLSVDALDKIDKMEKMHKEHTRQLARIERAIIKQDQQKYTGFMIATAAIITILLLQHSLFYAGIAGFFTVLFWLKSR